MSVWLQLPRLERDYWLSRSHDFRVVGPSGELGRVEDVYRTRRGPRLLLVVSGFLGRAAQVIRIEDVAAIFPDERRVVLEHDPP